MAPPKTRDAKFRESFAEYMTGFTKALGKLHPNARYEYMYALTKCGDWPGKKLHKYQLCIQKSDDTPSLPSVACWDGYFTKAPTRTTCAHLLNFSTAKKWMTRCSA